MENTLIDIRSLMRVSKFAEQIKKSPAWIYKLGKERDIDLVEIDGCFFVLVNDKSRKLLPR